MALPAVLAPLINAVATLKALPARVLKRGHPPPKSRQEEDEEALRDIGAGPAQPARRSSFRAPAIGAPAIAAGLGTGLVGGLIVWLALMAEETQQTRLARIPFIQVQVAGGGVPKAALAPADSPSRPMPPRLITRGRTVDTDAPLNLAQAPLPGLFEETPAGQLPVPGPEGQKPWQVYARPFPAEDPRGHIAIIVTDLGTSAQATSNVIETLPGSITLAFEPRVEAIRKWIDAARDRGHEVLLTVPMEPLDYPHSDPGPRTLLTFLPPDENISRLEWFLGRAPGVIGILSTSGSRFLQIADDLTPILRMLNRRGLVFVDTRITLSTTATDIARQTGVPFAFVDRLIDRDPTRSEIDAQLGELEKMAQDSGMAVGLARPMPVTIERVLRWQKMLNREKLALAPISALVERFATAAAHPPAGTAGGKSHGGGAAPAHPPASPPAH